MSTQEHILVVEDDASLAEWICDYLADNGYLVSTANRGDTAVELIASDKPDLVILDVMLPVKSGFQICEEVRTFFASPILMLTACNEEEDELQGLELGADDYLPKPVKPKVLLARIKALLRRSTGSTNENCRIYGKLRIDNAAKSVELHGEKLALSANEFDVLWLLAKNAGEVVSRTDLVAQLRGIDYDGFDRSIDIRVSRIRKKLQDDASTPYKIKTIWGKGYLFSKDAWD